MATTLSPNINWPTFAYCNENPTNSFESMTRRLFTCHFLKNQQLPHTEHNTPGIEVAPILEPPHADGTPQRRISFQSKYFDQESVDYGKIQDSARKAVKYYAGKLDAIYLFCNKTITTTTKGYKTAEKILADAGISLHPISNEDLLDLIFKYPDIYNYYFRPRMSATTLPLSSSLPNVTINGVTGAITISPNPFSMPPLNAELLNNLVSEKIHVCRSYVHSLEIDSLNTELEKLFTYEIDDVEGVQTLYYFKTLTYLHANKPLGDLPQKCGDTYSSEISQLIDFYSSPHVLSIDEFQSFSPSAQVFVLDRLFTTQHWQNIVDLYQATRGHADTSILTQFDLHYGLACFNLQQYDLASSTLHELYNKTHEPRMQMYSIFADIKKHTCNRQYGKSVEPDVLVPLLIQLDSYKELKQYQREELLVTLIKTESLYLLGFSDKKYLEDAISEYGKCSETLQKHSTIRFYYGLCLELNGDRGAAAAVYESLNWSSDTIIAERYMICLILDNKPETAISIFNRLSHDAQSIRTEAAHLLALEKSKSTLYSDTLVKIVESHSHSLQDLSQIAYYVENKESGRNILIPALKTLITPESLSDLVSHQKVELLLFLAHCNEISLLATILESIPDLAQVNEFTINEIYKSLFEVANHEYVLHDTNASENPALQAADYIADLFLATHVCEKNFLQIKVLCSGARQMPFSMLKYSKSLYEITNDKALARNIIALLLERKENRFDEYAPYISALENSILPAHCIAVASAMMILGRTDAANFHAYKSLYYLNGEDDFNIYKSYFSLYFSNIYRFQGGEQIRSVKGSVVVTLEESESSSAPHHLAICLDSETEFSDRTNRSMDVEHIASCSPEYIKLQGCGMSQIIRFRGKKYQICQIIPREQHALGYIFKKIGEHPDMFSGVVHAISTENVEEMIAQIKTLTDRSEQTKSLLRSYHFENNDVGLPIDAIAHTDYNHYIDALKYILYHPDEALYAGMPVYEDETGQKYVPSLSTLAILGILGRLDILAPFKSDFIIPESYHSFFHTRYSNATRMNHSSASMLSFVDEKPIISAPDKTSPEVWEAIIEFCENCTTQIISDEERIGFRITDELTGERFISGIHLHSIHLDALILASREKATYLCDDLFFRKLADWLNIRNLNFVSLLQHYVNPDHVAPLIMELSKTNYICIPFYLAFLSRSNIEIQELCKNILTGSKKKPFYSNLIQRYSIAWEQTMRELFGCEYAEPRETEAPEQDDK